MKTNKSVPEITISIVKASQFNLTTLSDEQMNWIKGGGIVPQDNLGAGIAAAARRTN